MKPFTQILIVFLSIILISCDSSVEKSDSLESTQEDLTLPKLDARFPELGAEAQDKITSWQYFKEFENDLMRINQGNVRSFRAETERMVSVSDSLLKNIPEGLETSAISSRMRVVNVRVKLLNETMNQSNVKTAVISENLKETNIAFSNLINQINEKFEKERIDELTLTSDNLERLEGVQPQDSL